MGCPDNARLDRQEKKGRKGRHYSFKKKKKKTTEVKKKIGSRAQLGFSPELTGVEDGGVDPALSEADGHFATGVAEQDICAASPGSRRHSVSIVASPVPHQHAIIIIMGIQLSTTKSRF